MNILSEIENLINKVETNISQKNRKEKIKLYAYGLKNKIKQTEFALDNLNNLS